MKRKLFSRENEIETILDIVNNKEDYKENSEHCMIILLNGNWGSGKTTFLNELCEKVNSLDDIEIFNYYNAYEHDFYSNAFIPFFASINDKVNLKNEIKNLATTYGKETAKDIVVLSYTITKSIFSKKTGIDLDDIKNNIKDIRDEEEKNDLIKEYKDVIELKKKIKRKISKISEKKTQIFIIDELDRCKPTFAMETLEIIKHFFDVDNCVFIISVDKMQLAESVKSIYGNGIDSEKYFSKLYDYQFDLPVINFADAIDYETIPFKEELVSFATILFNVLNTSLRDSKKIFNDLLSKYNDWTYEQTIFMLFLFTIKYTDLLFYNTIIKNEFKKYKELIEGTFNQKYSKYLLAFSFVIKEGKTLDFVLQELEYSMNKKIIELGNNKQNYHTSINSKLLSVNEIENDVLDIVPSINDMLTVKETIETIIS